ncbi:unnamed protein product [Polarella glacialis]|uniref:RRM domain-containing protein n=1 Tax=Polarella glacialis TaxID=89957 RepID=A0A813LIJ6_POLGL|nr:unnamed protein product [Polarella glacialis]
MWTGGSTTTSTERSLTLFVTNIPGSASLDDMQTIFQNDAGFCMLRAVGGGTRKMVFVDYGSEVHATQAMRKHQGLKLDPEEPSEGLKIDFDKDARSKRSRAMEKGGWSGKNFGKGGAVPVGGTPAGWSKSVTGSFGGGGSGKGKGKGKDGKGKDKGPRRRSREREHATFAREKDSWGARRARGAEASDFERALAAEGQAKLKKLRPLPSYLAVRGVGPDPEALRLAWEKAGLEEQVEEDDEPSATSGKPPPPATQMLLAAYGSSDEDEGG